MIGGYIYIDPDRKVKEDTEEALGGSLKRIEVWDNGCIFFGGGFKTDHNPYYASEKMVLLSEDLLSTADFHGDYSQPNLGLELVSILGGNGIPKFNAIATDFRLIAAVKGQGEKSIFLVSNRAGSGRMYYHELKGGILFCSDLRFLLRIIGFQRNDIVIYSILKYGAIPEPLTISKKISAVPPAHFLEYHLGTGKSEVQCYYKFKFEDSNARVLPSDQRTILEPVKRALQKSANLLAEQSPVMLLSGGIDSSLYGCYLRRATNKPIQTFYCAFGEEDPELRFAHDIAERVGADFRIVQMNVSDAVSMLEDAVQLTDHPFSDFSSLPVAFLLKRIREEIGGSRIVIECNGGDDCFGFPDLASERKFTSKHVVPGFLKRGLSSLLRYRSCWKWEGEEGLLAKLSALSDVHENSPLNYFMVLVPANFLGMEIHREWDEKISETMESVFAACGENYEKLSYKAKMTIRQLLHVNSRRWAAKALSVGESLGLRVVYPYIWREILDEQGRLPWKVKINDGVVKWPLKKLLEEFMPKSFIYREKSGFVPPFARWLTQKEFNHRVRDILVSRGGFVTDIVPHRVFEELLDDALDGKRLRHSILNFLWGAVFTETWVQSYKERASFS